MHSGDRNEVEAWLALRDRPQDINQQMTTWLYTAFSLACEEGRCEIAEMLIEAGADTSLPNHVGETGLDIARSKAKHRPHETKNYVEELLGRPTWKKYSDTVTMLEKWTKKPGHMLQTEEQRNLSRPVQSVPKERPEIGAERLGYWDAHHSAPSLQYRRFVKLNEGAYGWVTKVPVDIPVRDSSGKLHYEAAAKSTKASSSDDSSDASAVGPGTKQNKSSQSSQAEAEVKALSSEIQTLHKLDRANDPSSLFPHPVAPPCRCCNLLRCLNLVRACVLCLRSIHHHHVRLHIRKADSGRTTRIYAATGAVQ